MIGYKVPQKNGRLKPEVYKNKKYLNHMHNSGKTCVVCGKRDIELHHIKTKSNTDRDDSKIVPLCVEHHRGKYSPHGFDSSEFYEQYSKEMLLELAEEFFNEYLEENR